MFRRKVIPLNDALNQLMRDCGLDTPLLQRRLVEAWDDMVGPVVARVTAEKFIKNQTLFVKIVNPAVRAELSMRKSELTKQLNAAVGSFVIADIRVY